MHHKVLAWLVPGLLLGCTQEGENSPQLGQATWEQNCAVCHRNGIAGAPALGDDTAWAPRVAKGMETLVRHAVQGFEGDEGMMPAKGGNTALSEEQVAAAVQFMINQVDQGVRQ